METNPLQNYYKNCTYASFRAKNFSKIEFYSIVTGTVVHSGACTRRA